MRRSLALSLLLGLSLADGALAVSEPRLVADLGTELPLGAGSSPHGFSSLDRHVVFAARPDDHADRFYRSDGTATGTGLLAAPCAPLEGGWISLLYAGTSRAFYGVGCDGNDTALWTSDGKAAGTIPLLPAGAYQYASPFYPAPGWVEAEGQTYFFQGGNYAAPLELWKTDGTPTGTVRLAVLTDQNGATGALARMGNGELLLLVWEHFASLAVWRSDGTVAGTAVATAVDLGGPSFSVRSFAATEDAIYFMVEAGAPYVKQLWSSNGTSTATHRLASFDTGIWDGMVEHEGAVYFAAAAEGGDGIWRSDGTPATTRRIAALDGRDISPASFAFLGNRIYWLGFAADWSAGSLYGAPIVGGDPEEICNRAPAVSAVHCTRTSGCTLSATAWSSLAANRGPRRSGAAAASPATPRDWRRCATPRTAATEATVRWSSATGCSSSTGVRVGLQRSCGSRTGRLAAPCDLPVRRP